MKEFNENPFLQYTSVVVFISGTQFDEWIWRNCGKCKRENCEMKKELDDENGTIPLWAAKEIGCKYDPLHQTADLNAYCSKLHLGEGVNF
jgi:hypothetical protein